MIAPRLFWSPSLAEQDPDDATAGLIDASGRTLWNLTGDRWRPIAELPADAVPLIPATTGATP